MGALSKYLKQLYEKKVKVKKADQIKSRQVTDATLKRILKEIRKEDGGELYSLRFIKAGSHPAGTKIKKADEFDYNVPLTIVGNIDVKEDGRVPYAIVDETVGTVTEYRPIP